jgi:hypothetical protein
MERSNLICQFCQHTAEAHKDLYHDNTFLNTNFCVMCESYKPQVHVFKQDNLKYLEMLSKEKEVADLK